MLLDQAPTYLTYEDLAEEIKLYTYRPGWALTVFLDPFEGPCLYVVAKVEDSYNPGQLVPLRIRSIIPPMPSLDYFGEWLLHRVIQIELHEAREYLKRDGKMIIDPHDPIEPGAKTPAAATET